MTDSERGPSGLVEEERLVAIGMEVVMGILDEHEGKPNLEAIRRRSDTLLAHTLTGRPPMDYDTELLQAVEHDVPTLCDEVKRLRDALSASLERERRQKEILGWALPPLRWALEYGCFDDYDLRNRARHALDAAKEEA